MHCCTTLLPTLMLSYYQRLSKVSHRSQYMLIGKFMRQIKTREIVKRRERNRKIIIMLSFQTITSYSSPSAKALRTTSYPFSFFNQTPKFQYSRVCSNITQTANSHLEPPNSAQHQELLDGKRINYAGVRLEETVQVDSEKIRLDSWVSSRIVGVSRARVQSSIRSGLVSVNGRVIDKVSHAVRGGDSVNCTISELQPLRAEPEDIPLDIVHEDDHVLVVNKPAHMVVHPAPGNDAGTLVNAILHHCSLPTVALPDSEVCSEEEDLSDDELRSISADQSSYEGTLSSQSMASIRPGIVHRLDKGTSGLLVVAKNEHSHAYLSEQFKLHTIDRVYLSLTCGIPDPNSGRIDIPIGRDSNNRIRMTAVTGSGNSGQARHAASRYRTIEILAGGSSALVEWKLETGRTHQIRAHAKYMGVPLLGDDVYGGTKSMALSLLRPRTPVSEQGQLSQLVSILERPCLHARLLGFIHPHTGEKMRFSCPPPADFSEILRQLRKISTQKVDYGRKKK